MTDAMTADTPLSLPASRPWLRLALAVVAAIELLDALSSVPNIFADYHHPTALLRFAQALTSVKLALAPTITGAALAFAAFNKLRSAILALAALTLIGWLLNEVWSIPIHGFELTPGFGGFNALMRHFLLPAAAIMGAALALKDRRLALAGLLVSLPTIFDWVGVAVFTAAVLIYGF
jgi:hypothetical protein